MRTSLTFREDRALTPREKARRSARLKRRAQGPKFRMPEGRGEAMAYASQLKRNISSVNAVVNNQIVPDIGSLAVVGEFDIDAVEREVESKVNAAQARWEDVLGSAALLFLSAGAAQNIATFHMRGLTRTFERQTGQKSIADDPGTQSRLRGFARRNQELITKAVRDHFGAVKQEIAGGIAGGIPATRIAKQVRKRSGMLRRKVTNIARDQTQKLLSQLQRTRLKANGVKQFIWRNVGDDRVRPLHVEIDGEKYPLTRGHPTEGFPGDPVNCRCFMEPVFPADEFREFSRTVVSGPREASVERISPTEIRIRRPGEVPVPRT